jgi:hypothetical protein
VIGVILATVFFADFALMVANRITIDQRYTIQEERNRQFEVRQAKSDAQMEDAQRNLVTARAWSQLPQPNPTKTK